MIKWDLQLRRGVRVKALIQGDRCLNSRLQCGIRLLFRIPEPVCAVLDQWYSARTRDWAPIKPHSADRKPEVGFETFLILILGPVLRSSLSLRPGAPDCSHSSDEIGIQLQTWWATIQLIPTRRTISRPPTNTMSRKFSTGHSQLWVRDHVAE